MTEDEMVAWHHQLDGHEFQQTLGIDDGQGGLACCSPWGLKEPNTTERLNNNKSLKPINSKTLKKMNKDTEKHNLT